jgi:hypothetical protein
MTCYNRLNFINFEVNVMCVRMCVNVLTQVILTFYIIITQHPIFI